MTGTSTTSLFGVRPRAQTGPGVRRIFARLATARRAPANVDGLQTSEPARGRGRTIQIAPSSIASACSSSVSARSRAISSSRGPRRPIADIGDFVARGTATATDVPNSPELDRTCPRSRARAASLAGNSRASVTTLDRQPSRYASSMRPAASSSAGSSAHDRMLRRPLDATTNTSPYDGTATYAVKSVATSSRSTASPARCRNGSRGASCAAIASRRAVGWYLCGTEPRPGRHST